MATSEAALHEAVAALIGPTYGRLGFDATAGEGERTPTLRALAINLLGTVGADPAVRAEAARRFDASPIGGGSGDPIPADIEAATLAVVAQLLRPGDYDALLERYRNAATPQEEMRSLGALAVFPDVDLCLRTFDLAMTEVRSQNGFSVISALLANPVGNQAVWTRITETWDADPRAVPEERAAAHPRVAARAVRRCRRSPNGPSRSSTPTRWRRGRGAWPSRSSDLRVNVAFATRERTGWPTALRAASASPA